MIHQTLESKNIDLNRLTTVQIDVYKMVAVLSRANHSYSYGLPNADAEKQLCTAIMKDGFINSLQYFEDMAHVSGTDNDHAAKKIFDECVKSKGYFASLFRVEP